MYSKYMFVNSAEYRRNIWLLRTVSFSVFNGSIQMFFGVHW